MGHIKASTPYNDILRLTPFLPFLPFLPFGLNLTINNLILKSHPHVYFYIQNIYINKILYGLAIKGNLLTIGYFVLHWRLS